uniref:Uncharacterized protein n=1 Tax=Salix viminalis TaxID=40686 RepID=A0A6N2MG76_SALVM
MRGATRGLPRRSPILVLLSPKHLWNRYCDRRIFRISRFHPGALVEAALVNSGTKYRVDCGGGGVYYSRLSTFNCGVLMGSAATPDLIPQQRGEADRRRILPGVSGGRFPCSSYGIATVTAGSLEFQDFIPGPWLRQF